MDTRARIRLLVLGLTAVAAVAAEVLAYLLDGPGLLTFLRLNTFTQFACAAPYLMYRLWEPDERRSRPVIVAGGGAALMPLIGVPLGITDTLWALGLSLISLGAVGLVALFQRAFAGTEPGPWRERLIPAIYVPLAASTSPFYVWLSGRINPVYDLYVFAFEETLGPRFSVLAVHLFDAVPALGTAAAICYYALPLGIGALFTIQQRIAADVDIILAFAVVSLLGFGLYFVFPVVGPLNVYGAAFPDALPPRGSIVAVDLVLPVGAPRNGMPSLHAAWAVLIWLNARPLPPRLRIAFRVFAAMNLLATVGLHDAHWVTDLVVGAPLAIAVQALCATAPEQRRARFAVATASFLLVVAWFAALWWGIPLFAALPGLSWAAVLATLAAVAALARVQTVSTDSRTEAFFAARRS